MEGKDIGGIGVDDHKNLKGSWGDLDPPSEFVCQADPLMQSPEISPRELDRLDAPVLWIRKIFGATIETLESLILSAFKEHGIDDAKLVYYHISDDPKRTHAYLLLNSASHSEKLLKGVIPVVLPNVEDEDQVLVFEEADHLEPRENQDANILYLWNLDYPGKPQEIADYFHDLISQWSPVCEVIIQKDRYGEYNKALKVKMFCYEDTRKCIYLLNFRNVEGTLIRAGFCTIDYTTVSRYRPEKTDRLKVKPPVSSSGKQKQKPLRKPLKKKEKEESPPKNIIKASKNGWIEIPAKKKPARKSSGNNK